MQDQIYKHMQKIYLEKVANNCNPTPFDLCKSAGELFNICNLDELTYDKLPTYPDWVISIAHGICNKSRQIYCMCDISVPTRQSIALNNVFHICTKCKKERPIC